MRVYPELLQLLVWKFFVNQPILRLLLLRSAKKYATISIVYTDSERSNHEWSF